MNEKIVERIELFISTIFQKYYFILAIPDVEMFFASMKSSMIAPVIALSGINFFFGIFMSLIFNFHDFDYSFIVDWPKIGCVAIFLY